MAGGRIPGNLQLPFGHVLWPMPMEEKYRLPMYRRVVAKRNACWIEPQSYRGAKARLPLRRGPMAVTDYRKLRLPLKWAFPHQASS
eukprot:2171938-Prymnesium_polylepis.1